MFNFDNKKGPSFTKILKSCVFRYWARNYIGFPIFISKVPNTAHTVLADMEKYKMVSSLAQFYAFLSHTSQS